MSEMMEMTELARKSFGACQGIFGRYGPWPQKHDKQAHDNTYLAMQILVLREGLMQLSVGMTQLSVALKDLEKRVPVRR